MNRLQIFIVTFALVIAPAIAMAQDRFFNSNGVPIRYIDQGKGEPIVLIHGSGNRVEFWSTTGVLPNLAKDYRVIAFDLRGHGRSGKPHDPKHYGPEMALDVIRLLDHLGIGRAHIVGYSLGGNVNGLLVTLHPERFLTATFVAGTPLYKPTPEQLRINEVQAAERERNCVSRTLILSLAPRDQPPSDESIRSLSEQCLANPDIDRFAMAALERAYYDVAVTPAQVLAIKVPMFGIVGTRDPAAVPTMRALKELRPDIKYITVDGATHGRETGIVTLPEFITELRNFIGAHRGPSTAQ